MSGAPHPSTFTRVDKVQELRRELSMRNKVYARQVQIGRMNLDTMNRGLAIVKAMIADYESAEPDLFRGTPSAAEPDAELAEAAAALLTLLDALPEWIFEDPERQAIKRLRSAVRAAAKGGG